MYCGFSPSYIMKHITSGMSFLCFYFLSEKTFSADFGADIFLFPTEYLLTHIEIEVQPCEVGLTKACFTLNFKIN